MCVCVCVYFEIPKVWTGWGAESDDGCCKLLLYSLSQKIMNENSEVCMKKLSRDVRES